MRQSIQIAVVEDIKDIKGYVSQCSLKLYYHSLDIFVFPSARERAVHARVIGSTSKIHFGEAF